jgi:RHS repeat-associated protein
MTIEQINNSSGAVTYLHHDQAGSTRLLTGSTGTVTGKCSYAAYGAPTCEGAATTPLGYDAQYTSADTGLIYMRARVYDPATAQFLSVDPAEPITRAPYNYAGDNPLNRLDRTGLQEETQVCFIPGGCIPAPGGIGAPGQGLQEWAEKEWRSEERGWEGIEEKVGSIWNEITGGGNPQGGHRAGDLPGKSEPGSTGVTEKAPGVGTIREYGPDGWAETDYDCGHNHPPGCPGDPHAHDFEENPETGRLERGPGRPLRPGE